MKKILFSVTLLFLAVLAYSQNGLEKVIVEKYYVANQADHDASVLADVTDGGLDPSQALPIGAVTYRIYVDMSTSYKLVGTHGNANHALILRTSTFFYNNAGGASTGIVNWNLAGLRQNTRLLDSWVACGAGSTTANNWGVLKTEDAVAGGANLVLAGPAMLNSTAAMGLPLTTADGLYTSTTAPSPVSFAGFPQAVVGDGTANGNAIEVGMGTAIPSGSWYSTLGAVGPDFTGNKVLIAQITTDGQFTFELNINVQNTLTGVPEKYVARSPLADEIVISSLIYDSNNLPIAPTVSITSPTTGTGIKTGNSITIIADAHDANGDATITQVEFFAGAASLGVDATAPYSVSYSVAAGANNLTARATDADGMTTTSTVVVVNGVANPSPVISNIVVNPTALKVGGSVNISADVVDDASVASVDFLVDGVVVFTDLVAPYATSWTSVLGNHSVTIRATDNEGAISNSAAVNVSVVANVAPSVSISAPANNTQVNINTPVTLSASATDGDGSVSSVEFFVNGVSVNVDASSPYSFNWTPATEGIYNITAVATDNDGAVSAVSAVVKVNAVDPNSLPYQITDVKKKCSDDDIFVMPVVALKTVSKVIGFDITMKYDNTKVLPTNVVLVNNALVDSTLASASLNLIGNNTLLIQVSLNSNAPDGTFFQGSGQVCAVQFTKTNAFQTTDTAIFSLSKLEESYFTGVLPAVKVGDGMFITYKDSLFNGSLKFWADNSAMGYTAGTNLITKIFGNIDLVNFVTPDAAGNFVYNINDGQSISIRRDIDAATPVQAVINGMDGLLTQKVLLDDESFKPSVYQAVAMDINIDGRISAGDLSQISQRSVRRITEYKQAWNYDDAGVKVVNAPSKDWLFINDSTLNLDASYLISKNYPANDGVGFSKYFVPKVDTLIALPIQHYSTCPVISGQTFRGVLLGDVNGSYKSLASSVTLKSAKTEVVFDMANAVETESTIEIPVYTSSDENVQSLDFTISVGDNLEYAGMVKQNENYTDQSLEGSKEVSLFSFGKYTNGKASVVVRFNKLGTTVNASDIAIKAAYINGEKVGAAVVSSKLAKSEVSIYPNPATSVLNVIASEDAKIQVLDLSGKVITEVQAFANETEKINIEGLAPGVYMVKVSNKAGVKTQKVVIK